MVVSGRVVHFHPLHVLFTRIHLATSALRICRIARTSWSQPMVTTTDEGDEQTDRMNGLGWVDRWIVDKDEGEYYVYMDEKVELVRAKSV